MKNVIIYYSSMFPRSLPSITQLVHNIHMEDN